MSSESSKINLRSLDTLRGMAAIGISVFVHYSFFMSSRIPLGNELWRVFYRGQVFVELFFLISGMVFTQVYYHRIAQREVNFREFFVKRFARLYPLHLVTLLIVLGLQVCYFALHK